MTCISKYFMICTDQRRHYYEDERFNFLKFFPAVMTTSVQSNIISQLNYKVDIQSHHAHFERCQGAYGCYISHLEVWYIISSFSEDDWVCVLEDDADPAELINFHDNPPELEIIYDIINIGPGENTTVSYLIRPSTAMKLLQHIKKIILCPLDQLLWSYIPKIAPGISINPTGKRYINNAEWYRDRQLIPEIKIPRVIHQTWIDQDSDIIKKSIDNCKRVNLGYKHKFYTDNDQLKYIEKYFPEFVVTQYKKIQNGSCRSDFFRYCVLYIEGGVYIDIDCKSMSNLNAVISSDTDLIYAKSNLDQHADHPHVDIIYNGVLAAVPRLNFFNQCIHHICNYIARGVLNSNPSQNIHYLSGTHMLNHHITAYQQYVERLNTIILTKVEHADKQIIKYKNIPIICAQHYMLDRTITPHYSKQEYLYDNEN